MSNLTWNYRLMEWEHEGIRWRTFHTVFYDIDGGLISYTKEPEYPVAHEDEEMSDELQRFAKALTLPTLIDEHFPK